MLRKTCFLTSLLLISLAASLASASVQECANLVGTYKSLSRSHANLEIRLDASANTLNLVYDRNDDRFVFRNETYLVDGQQHVGDGNLTGDHYVANCHSGQLHLVRVLAKFIGPLHTHLTLQDRVLTEQATMDGVPGWTQELGKFEAL